MTETEAKVIQAVSKDLMKISFNLDCLLESEESELSGFSVGSKGKRKLRDTEEWKGALREMRGLRVKGDL